MTLSLFNTSIIKHIWILLLEDDYNLGFFYKTNSDPDLVSDSKNMKVGSGTVLKWFSFKASTVIWLIFQYGIHWMLISTIKLIHFLLISGHLIYWVQWFKIRRYMYLYLLLQFYNLSDTFPTRGCPVELRTHIGCLLPVIFGQNNLNLYLKG